MDRAGASVATARPILHGLDHVVVAVRDLEAAVATYRTLLGRAPAQTGDHAERLFIQPVGDGEALLRRPLGDRDRGLFVHAENEGTGVTISSGYPPDPTPRSATTREPRST